MNECGPTNYVYPTNAEAVHANDAKDARAPDHEGPDGPRRPNGTRVGSGQHHILLNQPVLVYECKFHPLLHNSLQLGRIT